MPAVPPAANLLLRRTVLLPILPETAAVHLLTETVLRLARRPLRAAAEKEKEDEPAPTPDGDGVPPGGGDEDGGVVEFEAQPSSGESGFLPLEPLRRGGPPGGPPRPPGPPPDTGSLRRLVALIALVAVLAVAAWETIEAVRPVTPVPADWEAAAAMVRAGFAPGDLIVFAPSWADPVGRAQLGDLMPPAMVGRPDGRRYRRIWEISMRGAHAEDVAGLVADVTQPLGSLHVARYPQKPLAVRFDLVDRLLDARVTQAPASAAGGPQDAAAEGLPCLWAGPLPSPFPPRGPAGAFACAAGRVERRTLEIDYRPRYGVLVTPDPGQRTVLTWEHIPDAAWRDARLWLWLGLHDYHARKTATGAAEVTVDIDHGALRVPLRIDATQGFVATQIPLTGGAPAGHTLRIEVTAPSRTHYVGIVGELRQ